MDGQGSTCDPTALWNDQNLRVSVQLMKRFKSSPQREERADNFYQGKGKQVRCLSRLICLARNDVMPGTAPGFLFHREARADKVLRAQDMNLTGLHKLGIF